MVPAVEPKERLDKGSCAPPPSASSSSSSSSSSSGEAPGAKGKAPEGARDLGVGVEGEGSSACRWPRPESVSWAWEWCDDEAEAEAEAEEGAVAGEASGAAERSGDIGGDVGPAGDPVMRSHTREMLLEWLGRSPVELIAPSSSFRPRISAEPSKPGYEALLGGGDYEDQRRRRTFAAMWYEKEPRWVNVELGGVCLLSTSSLSEPDALGNSSRPEFTTR